MMLSDVEEGDNLMLTRLTPVATLVLLVVCLHGCEVACALKQTFAQCKMFLQGHCW